MAGPRSDHFALALAHIRATQRRYVRQRSLIRWGLTGIAFGLGFTGFGGWIMPDSLHAFQKIADAFYSSLGLLTLRLPHDFEKPDLAWDLQVARFLLPAMAIWFSVEAYLRLARQRLRFFSLFRLSNHVIVVGRGPRAHAIAKHCRVDEPEGRLVYIANSEDSAALADLHSLGIIIIQGDPAAAEIYARSALHRARAIVIAGERAMENVRACATVRKVALAKRPAEVPSLSVVVAIDSPEMASVLDASFHEVRDRRVEYRLLDPLDNIAERLVARLARILGSPHQTPTILMLGWAGPAAAIFRRLLRNAPPGAKIVVVDENADAIRQSLFASAPGLVELPELQFIAVPPGIALTGFPALNDILQEITAGAIIINGERDEQNFRTALQLRRHARTHGLWTVPIHVREQEHNVALEALKTLVQAESTDVSRFFVFGSIDDQYAAETVLVEEDEKLARAIHDFYRARKTTAGRNTERWEDLMETFRTASRTQAQHIDVKLANAQCRQVSAKTPAGIEFSPDEIERLAVLEHWRWCVDRWLDGWTYAPERNDARLQHNLLVPYDRLSEDIKEFDRHAVRDIVPLVELAGATIQRELHIDADESNDADSIPQKAKDAKSNGMLPIVAVRLRTAEDLQLARDLQRRGIAVQLVAMAPIAVLAASMPIEQLAVALDAADDVVCGTAPSRAASGLIEAIPSADTAFA
ncbi:MAG TPA: RyR domain-containing protein [Stellaceae bacterium]|nr:RyR domain-containing protein [Stellaceae bacterium]